MDKTYYLQKLSNDKKKYSVQLPNSKKHVKFGAEGMMDYTLYYKKDGKEVADKHRDSYKARHKSDKLHDLEMPGFWAMNLLWNQPTVKQSIKDIEKKHNIKIVYSSS